MNNEYSKAYTEVLEIINHFSEDEYKKIPKEKIDFFEKNKVYLSSEKWTIL